MGDPCMMLRESRKEEVSQVSDKECVLQSLSEAWNQMNDAARSYLIGYGEGYIASRQAPAGA